MRFMRICAAGIACALVLSLAACGGGNSKDSTGDSVTISTAEQQQAIDDLAKDAQAVPQPDTKAVKSMGTIKDASTNAIASGDRFLGDWNGIDDQSSFVKITKNGNEYQYQDNDGTYKGTYKDGILTIQISDAANDTAKVYIDSDTGNLTTDYQGDIYQFSKKN